MSGQAGECDRYGKRVLVSDVTSEIGRAVAECFVRLGARVFIVSKNRWEAAHIAQLVSCEGFCVPLAADLSSQSDLARLAEDIRARAGGLDILVNTVALASCAPERVHRPSQTSATAGTGLDFTEKLVQYFQPALSQKSTSQAPARLVEIEYDLDAWASYCTERFIRTAPACLNGYKARLAELSRQLVPVNINANAILIGPERADDLSAVLPPTGAPIQPVWNARLVEAVNGAALFLTSAAAARFTGQVFPVEMDGAISSAIH